MMKMFPQDYSSKFLAVISLLLLASSRGALGVRCPNPYMSFCERSVTPGPKCKDFRLQDYDANSPSIIYGESLSRLGNQLLLYSVLITMHKSLGFQSYIDQECQQLLSDVFVPDFVELPVLTDVFCNPQDIPFESFNGDFAQLITDKSFATGRFLLFFPDIGNGMLNTYKPEDHIGPEQEAFQKTYLAYLKSRLRFSAEVNKQVRKTMKTVAKQMKKKLKDVTFVGIHNRRTDFLEFQKQHSNQDPLDATYFRDGMDYFREEYENVAFLYVSDDMEWGRQHLNGVKDLFFVGQAQDSGGDALSVVKSVSMDMALLCHCNHTLITRGTFGMWAALLAGGEYYTEYGPIMPVEIISG